MKQWLSLVALVLALSACSDGRKDVQGTDNETPRYLHDSQQWGTVVRNSIECNALTAIQCDGRIDIIYHQSDEIKIEVEGNEKVLENYSVKVNNGVLEAAPKTDGVDRMPNICLHVSSPQLESIALLGAGDLRMNDDVEFDNDLKILHNGSGDIGIEGLVCKNLTVELGSTGDFDAYSITCTNMNAKVSSSGDIYVKNIEAQVATLHTSADGDIDSKRMSCADLTLLASGSGEIGVTTTSTSVVARSTGTGNIEVKGSTQRFERQASALGKVDSRQLQIN